MSDFIGLEAYLDATTEDTPPPCKGLFYRCRATTYRRPGNGAYVQSVEFVPLKRRSCAGCGDCEYLHEHIRECGGEFALNGWDDGAVYELKITNYTVDMDGDYDCDIEFVPVPVVPQ